MFVLYYGVKNGRQIHQDVLRNMSSDVDFTLFLTMFSRRHVRMEMYNRKLTVSIAIFLEGERTTMNNMPSDKSLRTGSHPDSAADGKPNRTQEQALEDLIGVLEMAAVQLGWIYRPSGRDSSNILSQAARLSAAHAAYTLVSTHITRTTLGRTAGRTVSPQTVHADLKGARP